VTVRRDRTANHWTLGTIELAKARVPATALLGEEGRGFAQMAAALARALGREVVYNAVTPEQYRSFGFPGAEDLGNMFQFYAEFEDYFCAARSVDGSRALNPELQSFSDWLAGNRERIPLA